MTLGHLLATCRRWPIHSGRPNGAGKARGEGKGERGEVQRRGESIRPRDAGWKCNQMGKIISQDEEIESGPKRQDSATPFGSGRWTMGLGARV